MKQKPLDKLIRISATEWVNINAIDSKTRMYKGKGRPRKSDYTVDLDPKLRTMLKRRYLTNEPVLKTRSKITKSPINRLNKMIWVLVFALFALNAVAIRHASKKEIISPVGVVEAKNIEHVKPVVTEEKKEEVTLRSWEGEASYYSHDGCEGCDPDQIMANGQKFDENAMTLAFNYLPLNSYVTVKNPLTGKEVIAKVTDTGGFNAEGRRMNALNGLIINNTLERVADLSVGVKDAIGCGGLCNVIITEVK